MKLRLLTIVVLSFFLFQACSKYVPTRIQHRFFGKWRFVEVTKDSGNTKVSDYDGWELQLNKDHTATCLNSEKSVVMQGSWSVEYNRKELIKTREDWDLYNVHIELSGINESLIIHSSTASLNTKSHQDKFELYDSGWRYYLIEDNH